MIQTVGDRIRTDSLPFSGAGVRQASTPSEVPSAANAFDLAAFVRQLLSDRTTDVYREVISAVDRIVLGEVMEQLNGNQMRACKKLGIARMTLRSKLQAMGWYGEPAEVKAE